MECVMLIYILLTLTLLCTCGNTPLSIGESTLNDIMEVHYIRKRCHILCPLNEDRVCAIDSRTCKVRVFLNECLMKGINVCNKKEYYHLKSMTWCTRAKVFEEKQIFEETQYRLKSLEGWH